MKNTRTKALFIIDNVFYKGAFLNEELEILKKSNLDIRDYNLITNITTGVVQNRTYIDYIIKKNSKVRFKKIHKTILTILEMGIYQLLFLDRIPDYSIIDESVKLAKVYGNQGSSGFVNGMLRNIARNKDDIKVEKEGREYLEIKYSHPKYFIDEICERYSYEFCEELAKANNERPPFTIRVNTLKTSKENLIKSLINQNYEVENCKLAKDGLVVLNPTDIFGTKDFLNGDFYVQDEASILVSEILAPKENSVVMDMCAAPGGKSTHMSAIMNNTGNISSFDISDSKIKLVKENIKRLGVKNITLKKSDATGIRLEYRDKFDYILVDAPCSGLGLYRRKPEIKWNRLEEDLVELQEIQKKILRNASMYLKIGGSLVYSTCTISKLENEDVIDNFLEKNKNFEIEKYNGNEITRLFPNTDNTDGFTVVKLKKIGD